MEHKSYIWEKRLANVFVALCMIVFVMLFCFSMLSSWGNPDYLEEAVVYRKDSIIGNLFGMALFLLFLFAVVSLYKRFGAKWNLDWIAIGVSIFCTVISCLWISISDTVPQADQAYIPISAVNLDNGIIDGLMKGDYLGLCRHQLGLVTFTRILFRIMGSSDYRYFQYFSALTVSLLVFSGYKIVRKLAGAEGSAAVIYLVLMISCVPMYGYTPFVYGEICSTAVILFDTWIFLSCLEQFRWWKLIPLAVAAGLAVQMRRNTLIILIGFGIVLLVKWIVRPAWRTAAIGGSILVGALAFQAGIYLIYAPYTPEDSKPIPAILYIAMGTHDSGTGAGWYDGFHRQAFALADYDPEAAREVGREDIGLFLEKCKADPGYALEFYTDKIVRQWNAPMYQFTAANNKFAGEWNAFTESVYAGRAGAVLEGFMNIYQLILYGGVLFVLAVRRREWVKDVANYTLLIGVYGGFLFSLLWEAKTRYGFPYMILLIPYAAAGAECLISKLPALVRLPGRGTGKVDEEPK